MRHTLVGIQKFVIEIPAALPAHIKAWAATASISI
jgi:hypothetical protein